MNNMIVVQATEAQANLARKLVVMVFTLFGMIIMMLAVFALAGNKQSPVGRLPTPLVIPTLMAIPIPGFLLGLWYIRRKLNSDDQFWQLTDTELSCGANREQRFQLANIEKIIAGLPPSKLAERFQKAKPGTFRGTYENILCSIVPNWNFARRAALTGAMKENSMLICFKDGSQLPLRLYLFPNGSALMKALKERCRDRVIESYDYTTEEIKRLRRARLNRLIPANHIAVARGCDVDKPRNLAKSVTVE